MPKLDDFLKEVKVYLVKHYPWSSEKDKLDHYMLSLEKSLVDKNRTAIISGPAIASAWHTVGGKGSPTYAKLWSLTK